MDGHLILDLVLRMYIYVSTYYDMIYKNYRVGKTGSLRPWRRVMLHRRKHSLCQNDPHHKITNDPVITKAK